MRYSFEAKKLIKISTKADTKRDEGLTVPEDITYIDNFKYGEDEEFQTLDICFPKSHEGKLPVIVSVHGGGYVYGSTKVYMYYCASLAQRGFIVVNFNYRLAPKYKFPAPLEDLNTVLNYITTNPKMKDYPFDFDNVFILGDSAGAQIAGQYATLFTNKEYSDLFGYKLPDIKLKGLGFNCGRFGLVEYIKRFKNRGICRDYFDKDPFRFGEKLEVEKYVTSDFPPTHIITSYGDFMMPYAEPFKTLLDSKNVDCDCQIYGVKNVWHVFHVNVRWDVGIKANDDQTVFFKKYIS